MSSSWNVGRFKWLALTQSALVAGCGESALPAESNPDAQVEVAPPAPSDELKELLGPPPADSSALPDGRLLFADGTDDERYAPGALLTTPQGTLLSIAHGESNSVRDHVHYSMGSTNVRRSVDQGATWSPAQTVAGENAAAIVDLVRKKIVVLSNEREATEGGLLSILITTSSDDGQTFGESRKVAVSNSAQYPFVEVTSGHGVQLLRTEPRGRLIFPAAAGPTKYQADQRVLLISDDGGETFRAAPIHIALTSDAGLELIERTDGALLVRSPDRATALSTDRGDTFENITPKAPPGVSPLGGLTTYASKDQGADVTRFLTVGLESEALVTWSSFDEGESWDAGAYVRLVQQDAPARIAVTRAGTIGVLHRSAGGVAFTSFGRAFLDMRAACGADCAPVASRKVALTQVPASPACPHGATSVDLGLDTSGDELMDELELISSEHFCSSPEHQALVELTEAAPDALCNADTDTGVAAGLDVDGDQTLSSSEILWTSQRCSSAIRAEPVVWLTTAGDQAYSLSVPTGDLLPLSANERALVFSAERSPDGEYVATLSSKEGSWDIKPQSGRSVATFSAVTRLDWSPDGRFVAVLTGAGEHDPTASPQTLTRLELSSGTREIIARNLSPQRIQLSWAPDGSQLVYYAQTGAFALANNSATPVPLEKLAHFSSIQRFVWAGPERLVLIGDGQADGALRLYALDLVSEDLRRFGGWHVTDVAVSLDELQLAYTHHDSLIIAAVDGSEPGQVHSLPSGTTSGAVSGASRLRWHADGKHLLFVQPPAGELGATTWSIALGSPWAELGQDCFWSADDNFAACHGSAEHNGKAWTVRADGSERTTLPASGVHWRGWLPGSERLLYTRSDGDHIALHSVTHDGADDRLLLRARSSQLAVSWSQSAETLLGVNTEHDGFFVLSPLGGSALHLPHSLAVRNFAL